MVLIRTTVELEDSHVQAIKQRYGVRTTTEAVDLALRYLAGQPMSEDAALSMRGERLIGEPPPDTSPGR